MRRATIVVAAAALALIASPLRAQKLIVTERLEDLEARVRTDSNDAAAHYNVAMGYWARKRWADAERELRSAVSIETSFAQAYLALAVLHDRDTDYWERVWRAGKEHAVRDSIEKHNRLIARALLIDPQVDIRILGAVRVSYGGGGFSSAMDKLMEGQYGPAFDGFDREVEREGRKYGIDSVGSGALLFRALAAERGGHDSVALEDYGVLLRRAEQRAETDTLQFTPLVANEYRYSLAALQQRAGHAAEATRLYQDVLAHDISNYMAHVQLARMAEATRDYAHAIEERRRALEISPDDSGLLLDLGVTLGKAGQMAEATDVLQQAVAANPRDTRALYWLGIAYLQLRKPDDAKSALSRFIALAPSRYERQIAAARQRLADLH